MKIAQLNITHLGSTGKIMLQIADAARSAGHEVKTCAPYVFSRYNKQAPLIAENHITWGTELESAVHYYAGSIFGLNGLLSRRGTRALLRELKAFGPDVIHLHNLHNFCINLPMLFRYIKKNNIKVVWTLHDCWTFTGHCPHFAFVGCDKWKTGCKHCPQHTGYPKSYVDDSARMYRLKKKWFTGVDMTLVTPSQWLAELTRESFLKDYPVKVINNGIDLTNFAPTESDLREQYGCRDKKIILGVAFGWGMRKGLDVFKELAGRLDDSYRIILVGTDAHTDVQLPENIISIHRTENQAELAKIYSLADIFVNCTREDTFPTVNIEALACGTPVVTFRTGGSPECIDETCGSVVTYNDVDALEAEILRVCTQKPFDSESCRKRAESFEMHDRFGQYVQLYEEVANR